MENTPFVLNEKFRSENDSQKKERFQKEFERYIADKLSASALLTSVA